MQSFDDAIKTTKQISKILKALSSPTRLFITCFLLEGEKNVGEIIKKTGTSKGNISQHLKILLASEILENKKIGNKIYYKIFDKKIFEFMKTIKRLYCPKFKF